MISYGSFSFAEFAIIMMSFTIFKKSWKPTLLLQKDYSFHIWLEKIVHRLNFFKHIHGCLYYTGVVGLTWKVEGERLIKGLPPVIFI